jgi:hypothetical protein
MSHYDPNVGGETGPTTLQGAKLQSFRNTNPRDLFLRLYREHRNSSVTDLTDLLLDSIQDDPQRDGYIRTIVEYWVRNTVTSIDPSTPRRRSAGKVHDVVEKAARRVAHRASEIVLDLVMPNGKKLRDCTGSECLRMSEEQTLLAKRLAKIGRRIGLRQHVGSAFDETELARIWNA